MSRLPRPARLHLRLSPEEHDSLRAGAAEHLTTIQDYCRQRIFRPVMPPPSPAPSQGERTRQVRFQLVLAEPELAAIHVTAERWGLSAAEYVRARVLRRPDPPDCEGWE